LPTTILDERTQLRVTGPGGNEMSSLSIPHAITVCFQKGGDHQDRQRPASADAVRGAAAAAVSYTTDKHQIRPQSAGVVRGRQPTASSKHDITNHNPHPYTSSNSHKTVTNAFRATLKPRQRPASAPLHRQKPTSNSTRATSPRHKNRLRQYLKVKVPRARSHSTSQMEEDPPGKVDCTTMSPSIEDKRELAIAKWIAQHQVHARQEEEHKVGVNFVNINPSAPQASMGASSVRVKSPHQHPKRTHSPRERPEDRHRSHENTQRQWSGIQPGTHNRKHYFHHHCCYSTSLTTPQQPSSTPLHLCSTFLRFFRFPPTLL